MTAPHAPHDKRLALLHVRRATFPRPQERACRADVHRRRRARAVALAQLSDRHRLAHGYRLRAKAAVLAADGAWRDRAGAGAARSAQGGTVGWRRADTAAADPRREH